MRENTDQKKLRIWTLHAVCGHTIFMYFEWAMQISEMLCYEVLFQRLLERVQG